MTHENDPFGPEVSAAIGDTDENENDFYEDGVGEEELEEADAPPTNQQPTKRKSKMTEKQGSRKKIRPLYLALFIAVILLAGVGYYAFSLYQEAQTEQMAMLTVKKPNVKKTPSAAQQPAEANQARQQSERRPALTTDAQQAREGRAQTLSEEDIKAVFLRDNRDGANKVEAATPPAETPDATFENTLRDYHKELGLPQEAAPAKKEAASAKSRELVEILATLSEIKSIVANIENKVGRTIESSVAANPAPDPALMQAIQDMSIEIKGLTKARDDLQKALSATERRLNEMVATKAQAKPAATKVKEESLPPLDKLVEPKKEPETAISKWKVLGIASNRIVFLDSNSKTQTLGIGDTCEGVKILSIDVNTGNAKTSAGLLKSNL
jgi:cytoskeletal protein RodZ